MIAFEHPSKSNVTNTWGIQKNEVRKPAITPPHPPPHPRLSCHLGNSITAGLHPFFPIPRSSTRLWPFTDSSCLSLNTLLYVYLIYARGDFVQRNTWVETYGAQLFHCCIKLVAPVPSNAIWCCALTQPAFAFMLVTVKTTVLCTPATFSCPLFEFRGTGSRLIFMGFVWRDP